MRRIPLVLIVLAAFALAACTAGEEPGWTYAPAPETEAPVPGTPGAEEPAETPAGEEPAETPAGEEPGGPAEPGEGEAEVVATITSQGIAFDTQELEVPAGQPFAIRHVNLDSGVPHNIDIRRPDGTVVAETQTISDGEIVYEYPPLEAGEYIFICAVHPIPAQTGTLTVR
jgi:plastocyanin